MSNSLETSRGDPGGTPWLKIEQAGPRRLCLSGELDMAGVPEVRARLGAMTGDVELDCSGLTFIDAVRSAACSSPLSAPVRLEARS